MGAQPVELQREIEQQRRQVGEKLARLRNRLQPDIQEAQSAAKRQVARARKRAFRGFVFTASIALTPAGPGSDHRPRLGSSR